MNCLKFIHNLRMSWAWVWGPRVHVFLVDLFIFLGLSWVGRPAYVSV